MNFVEFLNDASFRKKDGHKIANAVYTFDRPRSSSIYNCGTYLKFGVYSDSSNRLLSANFCRDRLCPLCAKRRSLENFAKYYNVVKNRFSEGYRAVFLTLTVKNVPISDCKDTLHRISKAFSKLMYRFQGRFHGYIRTLEVTFNVDGSAHPHLHAIVFVKPGYFCKSSDLYVSHSELLQAWRDVYGDQSIIMVRIQTIGDRKKQKSQNGAIAEICKYCTKFHELVSLSGDDLIPRLKVLDDCLSSVHLISYGLFTPDYDDHSRVDESSPVLIREIVCLWARDHYVIDDSEYLDLSIDVDDDFPLLE